MAKQNCAVFDGVTEIYQTAEGTAIILSGGVLGSKQVRTTPRAGSKTDDTAKEALEQLQVREVLAQMYRSLPQQDNGERQIVGRISDPRRVISDPRRIEACTWVQTGNDVHFVIHREDSRLVIELDLGECQKSWDWMYQEGRTTMAAMNMDFLRAEALKATELLQSQISMWDGLRISFVLDEEHKELEESVEFAMRRDDLRIAGELTYDPVDRVGEILMSANRGGSLPGDRVDAFVLVTDAEVIVKMTYNGFGTQGETTTRKVVVDWLNEANVQLPIRIVSARR